jgi:protein tyrosine/serine phosphatase
VQLASEENIKKDINAKKSNWNSLWVKKHRINGRKNK